MKDTSDIPNPSPTTFNGIWTHWPELHDQKSLKKSAVYCLQSRGPVPQGGKPFFVEFTHPGDLGDPRLTLEADKAKRFHGDFLLSTAWEWERLYSAIPQ